MTPQARTVSTHARERNEVEYNKCTDQLNEAAHKLNGTNMTFETVWQVRPEKRLPHLLAMREQLDRMIELNLHYDQDAP
jgi:hypothetical protein